MVNFASLDPAQKKRNIKGLSHASRQDSQIWDEFNQNWENLAFESQRSIAEFTEERVQKVAEEQILFDSNVPTEAQKSVRVRLVQRFFRETVLSSYNFSCAICRLNLPVLLNASHIIPWSVDITLRMNPQNGICMCVLHDKAFDKGLITIDDDYSLMLSTAIKKLQKEPAIQRGFISYEANRIRLPDRFTPDKKYLEFHRNNIFIP
jgi:putative restriction endonuclease